MWLFFSKFWKTAKKIKFFRTDRKKSRKKSNLKKTAKKSIFFLRPKKNSHFEIFFYFCGHRTQESRVLPIATFWPFFTEMWHSGAHFGNVDVITSLPHILLLTASPTLFPLLISLIPIFHQGFLIKLFLKKVYVMAWYCNLVLLV